VYIAIEYEKFLRHSQNEVDKNGDRVPVVLEIEKRCRVQVESNWRQKSA
jgi:hypothetical protein